MSVYKDDTGRWRYRKQFHLANGKEVRISGSAPKHDNTKSAAELAEREHWYRTLNDGEKLPKKEAPTYAEWFNDRFWKEWVIGERNKPSERANKLSIFKTHLDPAFGELRLDEIGPEQIQKLRAGLVERGLKDKSINNIMAVLSKTLRYAADVELIERVPKIRLRKIERPEIETYSFEEYAAILEGAKAESPWWYAAACLGGEAGLRIGEIRELRWREDVDLANGYLTVNRQARKGEIGTPKGRTRRSVPMTSTLVDALKALPEGKDAPRDLRGNVVRDGYVIHNDDGTAMRDAQTSHAIYRVCERAEMPPRGWHTLRHSYGTHAARFGVNLSRGGITDRSKGGQTDRVIESVAVVQIGAIAAKQEAAKLATAMRPSEFLPARMPGRTSDPAPSSLRRAQSGSRTGAARRLRRELGERP